MYTELRNNVVSTVYESWKTTGLAWEQYNPETGAGQRTQGAPRERVDLHQDHAAHGRGTE